MLPFVYKDIRIISVTLKFCLRSLESRLYTLDQSAGELDYLVAYSQMV